MVPIEFLRPTGMLTVLILNPLVLPVIYSLVLQFHERGLK
jgi:hypothetical protein